MLLIREIMYCKSGKVRPMVEKFLAMAKLNEKQVELLEKPYVGIVTTVRPGAWTPRLRRCPG